MGQTLQLGRFYMAQYGRGGKETQEVMSAEEKVGKKRVSEQVTRPEYIPDWLLLIGKLVLGFDTAVFVHEVFGIQEHMFTCLNQLLSKIVVFIVIIIVRKWYAVTYLENYYIP